MAKGPQKKIKLQSWLNALRIQQNELAAGIGCDPSTISNIARGDRKPSLDLLHEIKDFLGIGLDDLYEDAPSTEEIEAFSRFSAAARDKLLAKKRPPQK